MAVIRDAIRIRYELLPLWYTVFYESTQTGLPVMRPLWLEYPRDKNTYEVEDQFLVGNSLMVRPVTEQYTTSVHLYLPGATAVSVCVVCVHNVLACVCVCVCVAWMHVYSCMYRTLLRLRPP